MPQKQKNRVRESARRGPPGPPVPKKFSRVVSILISQR